MKQSPQRNVVAKIQEMTDAELVAEASRRERELRAYLRLRGKYGSDHNYWPPEAVAAELERD